MKHSFDEPTRIYQVLRAGGLALVPTDVGYALIAIHEPALRHVYELKGQPLAKTCVAIGNPTILACVALPIATEVRRWLATITKITPLTVVAEIDPGSPLVGAMSPFVRAQTTRGNTMAMFLSPGDVVEHVAELALDKGRLVFATAAHARNHTLGDVPSAIRVNADYVLDHGPVWYENVEQLTTILDLTTGTFVRKGINYKLIERSWRALGAVPFRASPESSSFARPSLR